MRLGHRISACKKCDLVALANQFLSEIRYNPFGTAIVFWRYALIERRDLSNTHSTYPFLNKNLFTILRLNPLELNHKRPHHSTLVAFLFQPSRITSIGFLSSRK